MRDLCFCAPGTNRVSRKCAQKRGFLIIMKYLIIGAGGTGGTIGYYMAKAGKDVTLIARGEHLLAINKNGLTIEQEWKKSTDTIHVNAYTMEDYNDNPDVIFVCVKGYSLGEVVPFIKRAAKSTTIVIPILNIYGTGGKLQKQLPGMLVTDGCIYVSAYIKKPGMLLQNGAIMRLVYGVRNKEDYRPVLEDIKKDLDESGIEGRLTDDIQKEALEKFSYVSPVGAAGLYHNATAGDFKQPGAARDTLIEMMKEITALAKAMGHPFDKDMVEVNLKIMSGLSSDSTTSMQRDVMAGKKSEVDGLVYEVVRLGEQYGVDVPAYKKAADKLKTQVAE